MQAKTDKAEKVLRRIMEEAKNRFLPIIDYFGDGSKGALLEKVVKRKKPRLALEIGTLVGYSAIKIIRNMPKSGKLITLEIDSQIAAVARRNLEEAGVAERAEAVVGPALETIPKLAGKGKFDFVFIDAAKDEYFDYLRLLEKYGLLNKKAVVVADNVKMFRAAVSNYLDHVRSSGKYSSEYYDFSEDGVEVSEKL